MTDLTKLQKETVKSIGREMAKGADFVWKANIEVADLMGDTGLVQQNRGQVQTDGGIEVFATRLTEEGLGLAMSLFTDKEKADILGEAEEELVEEPAWGTDEVEADIKENDEQVIEQVEAKPETIPTGGLVSNNSNQVMGEFPIEEPAQPSQQTVVAATVNTQFEIRTDVPLPKSKKKGAKRTVYPFEQLKIGHSFVVPIKADKEGKPLLTAKGGVQHGISSPTVSQAAKRLDIELVSRVLYDDDGNVTGRGVWRVEPVAKD